MGNSRNARQSGFTEYGEGTQMKAKMPQRKEPSKANKVLDTLTDVAGYIPLIGSIAKFARKVSADEGSKYHMPTDGSGSSYAKNFLKAGGQAALEVGGGLLLGKVAHMAGRAISNRIMNRGASMQAFRPNRMSRPMLTHEPTNLLTNSAANGNYVRPAPARPAAPAPPTGMQWQDQD
jgi:hypothetical protein